MAYLCICHAVKESDSKEKKRLVGTNCGNCIKNKKKKSKRKIDLLIEIQS